MAGAWRRVTLAGAEAIEGEATARDATPVLEGNRENYSDLSLFPPSDFLLGFPLAEPRGHWNSEVWCPGGMSRVK